MKFFLDSCDLNEIKEISDYGFIDGVTTDPSSIAHEVCKGSTTEQVIGRIIKAVNGEVHIQVVAQDYDTIMSQALKIHSLGMNVIVKIPATLVGLKAMLKLNDKKVKCSASSVYNSVQAIMAAQNYAEYVSIRTGAIESNGRDGMELAYIASETFKNSKFDSKVLVTNISNPEHIVRAGMMGVGAISVPYNLIKMLGSHINTEKDIVEYMQDWNRIPESSRTFFNS
ncbi:MAG: fructose-6-phosphate aldolase [Candidatus Thermoplasmatota archaeon]|nr:fructose-6-phosphate aldolase [Candidatus Thermoplasmatota archaeon]